LGFPRLLTRPEVREDVAFGRNGECQRSREREAERA